MVVSLRPDRMEPVVWRITPLTTPRIHRHCPHCGDRRFASTDRFRLNANKQLIDVWLIYRCETCEATWNLTILTRTRQRDIDPDLLERMTRNDPETARACALDAALLSRAGARTAASEQVLIDQTSGDLPRARSSGARVTIDMPHPCRLRLDRLLATHLGLPRSSIARQAARGAIAIIPAHPRPLSRPVRDQLIILLAPSVLDP
jgi:hypothetical protein